MECEVCTWQDAEGSAGCRVLCGATDEHLHHGGGVFSFRKREENTEEPIGRCLAVPHGKARAPWAHLAHTFLRSTCSALLMALPNFICQMMSSHTLSYPCIPQRPALVLHSGTAWFLLSYTISPTWQRASQSQGPSPAPGA